MIGWVALSVLFPGVAHLRAGWRRTGASVLAIYLSGVAVVITVALMSGADLAGRLIGRLGLVAVMSGTLGVAWFVLVVHSYVVLRPGRLSVPGQLVSGVLTGVLAVVSALPFGLAAHYAAVSQRTIDGLFTSSGEVPAGEPFGGRERVNILLLGGDLAGNRVGVRTDSINVASVDVRTGHTVMFGLPRNLEGVRFPEGSPMYNHFPFGFRLPSGPGGAREDLLFSVWEYADQHPEVFGGRTGMGAQTLKETVGEILGMRIDWYTLVNIGGFAKIIDAIGGLELTVGQNVVYGRHHEGLIPAGTRRLTGEQALWFARSRTFSDDYARMKRQKCVFAALLDQAEPATVLTRFTEIATATEGLLETDIPVPMLEHLVPLAAKVKRAGVTSVQFVPPMISTAAPDWEMIRAAAAKAISGGTGGHGPAKPPKITEGCAAVEP
ncbi:LCP family protein [Herbidospora cretacea]|uniref:LCP family protein n=1 Tax=Herbidospora cretacea TaxID=28444 RepID=UPI00077380A3|nr:LCP family protein [Herbidospora cretacea]